MQRLPKSIILLLLSISASSFSLFARVDIDTAYARVANERAAKIVSSLHLEDAGKSTDAQTAIADQYMALNDIQFRRDSAVKEAKATIEDKGAQELRIKTITSEAAEQTEQQHKAYITRLTALLTAEQVDKVKNGMTYNVLPNTYNAYLDMLPQLTEDQKKQIMIWLTEARERAMDAETSKKKHEVFGKYKGRINNYLSAAGIDMKKEGEAWQKRIKARAEQ
ncbi:FtsZ-binding cell division protein ZapB [Filimonas zeae]|uniref:DUF3826 domain-containing protein n=1 Tax=Filimonas zeae TaxID=1737353 RepID=A0A917ISG2_9BACT|nr:DUF3826 domain-containing protein [Filimonas zeae]MDR6337819.1 FtsZ-binding cell division protein ZapB [Filimonas zeae]GGH60407.1 hypothetical protein GCM10011379_08230 [Filimonas zeae]